MQRGEGTPSDLSWVADAFQVAPCTPTLAFVATWADVRRCALDLPEAVERGRPDGTAQWWIAGKLFVWERPLRRADLDWLGAAAPDGPVLAARVLDLGAREALLAEEPEVFFTTPHFTASPIVLIHLVRIPVGDLRELVVEAWFARAPKRLIRGGPTARPATR
ncbi:MAG: MmcQ/YjbR family DNA-binding protein [Mycobacteriales bacterium]